MADCLQTFPARQLVVRDPDGMPRASLSCTRTDKFAAFASSGDLAQLPTWDDLAGGDERNSVATGGYRGAFEPDGGWFTLMSMNGDPTGRQRGLAVALLAAARTAARKLGARVAGLFRPTGYGAWKRDLWLACGARPSTRLARHLCGPDLFDHYCRRTAITGGPADPWLRLVARHAGVRFRGPRANALSVAVPPETWRRYRDEWRPDRWYCAGRLDGREIWECGETGHWKLDETGVVYRECNWFGEASEAGPADRLTEE
jgi:hypothetical protein